MQSDVHTHDTLGALAIERVGQRGMIPGDA
jgi:hypothetical protein